MNQPQNPYGDMLQKFAADMDAVAEQHGQRPVGDAGLRVGNRDFPGYVQQGAFRGGMRTGAQAPDSSAPRNGGGGGGGGGTRECGTDPTSPNQGGFCVCGPDECEYDPAIFCGWSALPFSTFKEQGDAPDLAGPVLPGFGSLRTVRITAERACKFRVRGLWMRAYQNNGPAIGFCLLANVVINDVPRVVEIGNLAPERRIGIPTSMFDETFFVLPVDWGIVDAINNVSRPLQLQFMNPTADNNNVAGVLFGDTISENGAPTHGNHAYNWT